MQKNKNILNSLAAVIHKNKCNSAGNSEKVVHPRSGGTRSTVSEPETAHLCVETANFKNKRKGIVFTV